MRRGKPGKEKPVSSFGLAFGRFFTTVFALRCPNCGAGRIARGPFNIAEVCNVCGAKFARGDAGNWLVAATLNYFFTAVLCILVSILLVRIYGFFSGLAFVVAGFALVFGALLYRPMKALAVWLCGFLVLSTRIEGSVARYMLSDLGHLTLQTETLFVQEAKRLLYVNEPDQPEAPRFFLGRTKEGVICRFRNEVPDKIVKQLEEVVTNRADLKNLEKETVQLSELFESILRQHKPIQSVWSGPAYRFPNEVDAPDGVVKITGTNINLLDANFADLKAVLESRQPCVAVVQENRAVSVCCSSRTSPHAAEAGLETHPAFRRRGYAARVVIGWAAAVREQGRIPLYSTAWDNGASRAVAKKLGLIMYATDLHFT